MNLELRHVRAGDENDSERLSEQVDKVDSDLADAEGELQDLNGELEDAMREVERLTKEVEGASAKVERLQGEFSRAYTTWLIYVQGLPEEADVYEPGTLISEFGQNIE